jgi:hypothetical protein
MPLTKDMKDVLKLVADLPEKYQEIAVRVLLLLVIRHEDDTTMSWEQKKQLADMRLMELVAQGEAFKAKWKKNLKILKERR